MNVETDAKPDPLDFEWLEVEGGEFPYGHDQETINVDGFWIAKFPVTNAQYKLFLESNPHIVVPEGWSESEREYPAGTSKHPVVMVTYQDALAFCQWAGCRLPSEVEWEKAARGTDGRTYPWGNDWEDQQQCNNSVNSIDDLKPVDQYELGVSPYGVWDMCGNAHEWTSSDFDANRKVLRGGSWMGKSPHRITSRADVVAPQNPDGYIVGFRCAKSG